MNSAVIPSINRYLGSCSVAECTVPEGAILLDLKFCELCGRTFARQQTGTVEVTVKEGLLPGELHSDWLRKRYDGDSATAHITCTRRRDHGQRFCRACRGRQLQPDIAGQEQYKAQLPNEREAKHARVYQMPEYDKAPMGRKTQAHAINRTIPDAKSRRHRTPAAEKLVIKGAIAQAFAERGSMTMEGIQEFIPNCWTPHDAYLWCYNNEVPLVRIGWGEKQEGIRGAGPGLYELKRVEAGLPDCSHMNPVQNGRGEWKESEPGSVIIRAHNLTRPVKPSVAPKPKQPPMQEFSDEFIEQKLKEFRSIQ